METSGSIDHCTEFHTRGFTVVRQALSSKIIQGLRTDCDIFIDYTYDHCDLLQHAGCVIETINAPGAKGIPGKDHPCRCSIEAFLYERQKYPRQALFKELEEALFHTLPSLLVHHGILPSGPSPIVLMNEQYIVKPPQTANVSVFNCHQDSQYMDESVRTIPQVALWIPLDSVDKTNGTVWVHPFPPMDSEEARDIRLPPNDFSAWHTHLGQESQKRPCPAIPILASPGDLLILSPHAFHFNDLHPLALAIPCRYGNKVNTTL
ncbi:MAG: hypothetical protein DHS80DRAFT_30233 [Piptocephalis tieghemiana]|nr:MAG: hypothetical protein DHS80DRAFT_30233 [Piptocephalis tieghemiana]